MTLLLITSFLAIGWIVVAMLLCLGLCASAAEGDRGLSDAATRLTRPRRFRRAHVPKAF